MKKGEKKKIFDKDIETIRKIVGEINSILNQYGRYMQSFSQETYIAYLRLLEAEKLLEPQVYRLEQLEGIKESMEELRQELTMTMKKGEKDEKSY